MVTILQLLSFESFKPHNCYYGRVVSILQLLSFESPKPHNCYYCFLKLSSHICFEIGQDCKRPRFAHDEESLKAKSYLDFINGQFKNKNHKIMAYWGRNAIGFCVNENSKWKQATLLTRIFAQALNRKQIQRLQILLDPNVTKTKQKYSSDHPSPLL